MTTRVQALYNEGWIKLQSGVFYLRQTYALIFILESNNTGIEKWWVDVAFAAYYNMISHTDGTGMMGNSVFYSTSRKQNSTLGA